MHPLARESLLDGHEHAAMLDGSVPGIQALADQGYSAYFAVPIISAVPAGSSRPSSASLLILGSPGKYRALPAGVTNRVGRRCTTQVPASA